MGWFLYDNGLRNERVKKTKTSIQQQKQNLVNASINL